MTTTLPDTDAVVEDGYVPVVSLAGLDDPLHRAEIAQRLGDAMRRSGFYVVVDHDVPRRLFDDLCAAAPPVPARQTRPGGGGRRTTGRPPVSGDRPGRTPARRGR